MTKPQLCYHQLWGLFSDCFHGPVNLTKILWLEDALFPICAIKETGHLQDTLAMVCICTFLACRLEMWPKRYLFCTLSREATLQSGSGFRNIDPKRISSKRKRISEFIVDETAIKAGSECIWLWVAIEPKDRQVLALSISKERNMFVAERFIAGLARTHGNHPVSTDGGTWYPQA